MLGLKKWLLLVFWLALTKGQRCSQFAGERCAIHLVPAEMESEYANAPHLRKAAVCWDRGEASDLLQLSK